jgi:molybdenum cofactor biosynthesis enzyme MoaA
MPRQSAPTYGDGWFAEEQHQSRPFRWMGLASRCRFTGLPAGGPALLRLTGGVWENRTEPPVLSVTINGRHAGSATVSAGVDRLAFPFQCEETVEIELTLDRTFTVPGDGRALGIMVRGLDVLAGDDLGQAVDAEGWLDWEHHEYFPFRWMASSARLVLPAAASRGRFAQVPVSADCADGEQVLTIAEGGRTLARWPLLRGWHVYDLALGEPAADAPPFRSLEFNLNRLWPLESHKADLRELGVRVGPMEVHDDRRRHEYVERFYAAPAASGGSDEVLPLAALRGRSWEGSAGNYRGLPAEGEGWFNVEHDDSGPFRWMGLAAALRITPAMRGGARYCLLPVFSSYRNLKQELTIRVGGVEVETIPLLKAWYSYSVELPPSPDGDFIVELRLNTLPPAASHDHDPRPVGARVGQISFHDDPERHERQRFMYRNAVTNQQELQAGATTLSSFPLLLGIDLYGKCNIKPACVYCLWDPMKELEGEHVDTPIDDRTLASYGEFFQGARQLVNCSFGEPLLHPRFGEILEFMASNGKTGEVSSNGQAFNPRTVRALEGRPIHLYVSLDSATAGTYARLRNDRWHEIVTGLLFLRDARRRGHGWPRLNLVFMPMRANRQDLEAYFKLCQLVEADQLVLRPLLYLEKPEIERDRGGYHFDYAQELLSRADLETIFSDCGTYARRYKVSVVSQFDFGKIEAPVIGEGRVGA